MKPITFENGGAAGIDTKFVLFFLALEYGRAVNVLSIEGFVMGLTLVMVLVLPYFLLSRYEMPTFSNWLLRGSVIAAAGVGIGLVLGQNIGVVLPKSAQSMPMTFLILAATVSCLIQFYGLLKLRQAN